MEILGKLGLVSDSDPQFSTPFDADLFVEGSMTIDVKEEINDQPCKVKYLCHF